MLLSWTNRKDYSHLYFEQIATTTITMAAMKSSKTRVDYWITPYLLGFIAFTSIASFAIAAFVIAWGVSVKFDTSSTVATLQTSNPKDLVKI